MIDTEALRKKLIDLAIQGKLTQQFPDDGNAEDLYAQIQEEKARLFREGKNKKEKSLSDISCDEIPFEIPNNWKWVRAGNIVQVISGTSYDKNDVTIAGIRVLRGGNIQDSRVFYYPEDVFVPERYEDTEKSIKKDDVLIVASTGSSIGIGKAGIVETTDESTQIGAFLRIIRSYSKSVSRYVDVFYSSDEYKTRIRNLAKGMNINNIKEKHITEMPFPLPPLEEQKRIIDKLDCIFKQIDIIDSLQQQYESDCEVLKCKIIDAGIRGKLTEQLTEDGNAEDLYAQIQEKKAKLIKEGKIKKEKPLPIITDDEIPFEISKNWKWVRLGTCINLLSGQDFPPEGYNSEGLGIPYITGASNIENGKLIVNRWTQQPRNISSFGDLLLVCKGSGFGKLAINNVGNVHIARQFMAISVDDRFLELKYIQLILLGNTSVIKSNGQGLIPGIDRPSVMNLLMPLPPTAEQKRIATTIEAILEQIS